MGSVHRTRLWGEKRSAEREEAVCDGAEAGVVVEAAPGSPFEVVEAKLLLQFLVVALDAPAQLGGADEVLQRGLDRQRREPELGRLRLALRPGAEEPLQVARRPAATMPSGHADAHGDEAGGLPVLGTLAPGHRRVVAALQRLRDICNGHRDAVVGGHLPGRPDLDGTRHADDVLQAALGETVAEVADVAVASVREDQVFADAPGNGIVELVECNLPLLAEHDALWNADLFPPRQVAGPRLGQVDAERDAAAPGLAGEVKARGHLAVVGAAERARVLPRHADRGLPLLREAGVIDDQRLDVRQLGVELEREPAAQLVVGPVAHRDALLEALPHRLDLGGRVHQARRHRLDALALPVEQEARDVQAHGAAPLLAPHALHEGLHVLRELPLQLRNRPWVHPNGRQDETAGYLRDGAG